MQSGAVVGGVRSAGDGRMLAGGHAAGGFCAASREKGGTRAQWAAAIGLLPVRREHEATEELAYRR